MTCEMLVIDELAQENPRLPVGRRECRNEAEAGTAVEVGAVPLLTVLRACPECAEKAERQIERTGVKGVRVVRRAA